MKHIYTLFFALITSVTFGQYAVGTSTLFSGGGAAYPHVLTAATPADGNTGEAVTMVMNVTSLPAGGANFRVYKTNASSTGVFGSIPAITLGENTITVAAVDFARAVKFQFDPAAAGVEFDQVSINGVELLGNVDFKTGYASGELSNNPNWKAGTGKYVVDPAAGTATVEADYAKAVMGQPFKMMADGDALTYKLDFALNSTLGSANKILMRSGFTHVNGTNSSGANENVVHISINSWNGSLAVRNNSNVGNAESGFQGVFLNPADVNNATVSIEVTLTLGADAASSTISGKLVSSTGNESTVGSYTGIQDALYTAATTGDGIYAMFNSAALSQCGTDGGPLTGGVSLSNLSVTPPAPADTTAPVITLTGDAVMELTVGDTYADPGFAASDDTDGDITSSVVVAGDSVDTSAAGQYVVTYNVSDAAGNAATEVTRTVNVSADPCANANNTAQPAADFDADSVDISVWHEDNATYEIVDGASTLNSGGVAVGGTGNILKYVDAGGEWYSNIQIRTCNKIDLNIVNVFRMDVYLDSGSITGTSPNQLELKLQDNTTNAVNPWENQSSIVVAIEQLDTWVSVEFDFSSKIDGTLDRLDFDNIVIQFNGEGQDNANPVTAFIDNFESDYVVPVDPSITSYSENFDDGDSGWGAADGAAFVEAEGYGTVSNTNATDWAHTYIDVDPLDLSAADKGFSFKVKGMRASKVFFKLQVGTDYANNHEWPAATENYTTPGEWQTIVVDATGQTSSNKTRIVIFFDTQSAASVDSTQDVFMIDDFEFGELATLSIGSYDSLQDIVAYPNPTRDFWNVEATSTMKSVQLFDVVGRELMRLEPNANTVRISTKTLKSGIYFAKINDGEMMKLIKR